MATSEARNRTVASSLATSLLVLVLGCVATTAAFVCLTPSTAQAQTAVDQIKTLYREGLEAYDFFEYQQADKKFQEAIDLAKANNVKDPIVARVYLAKGILFHAQFKDTAAQVAYDKTRDEFISAVSFDYDIAIPDDYYTDELQAILEEARSVVKRPDNGGSNNNTTTTNNTGGTGSVTVSHNPVSVADACAPVNISARIPPHPDAFRAYVHYRAPQGVTYSTIELMPDAADPERFTAQLPADAVTGPTLDYYVEVVNRQQAAVATAGSRSQPLTVNVIGECVAPTDNTPLVQIYLGIGTGIGFVDGAESERCKSTPECHGGDPERFSGVGTGGVISPLFLDLEVGFNVIRELQLTPYFRLQLIEFVSDDPAFMVGLKARYFILADQPHRFYTGLGIGYGDATYVVDLGPEFNSFRDVVRAKGPVHIGPNIGYAYAFHENVGIAIDAYLPIHFPDFTFHLDLGIGPFVQF